MKEPPSGNEWLHELKFDGYRMFCRVDRGRVSVWSRNGKDWTDKFQNVVEAVRSLKATSAILDGEIVIVDEQGRSSFQKLQRAMGKATTTGFAYEVFDLIYLDGFSLTQTPLKHRRSDLKKQLDKLSRRASPLAVVPKDLGLRETHWTEPKMIAEVAFTEWTSDGSIRHPSFQGLREDKNPKEVAREEPTSGSGKSKTRPKRSR